MNTYEGETCRNAHIRGNEHIEGETCKNAHIRGNYHILRWNV